MSRIGVLPRSFTFAPWAGWEFGDLEAASPARLVGGVIVCCLTRICEPGEAELGELEMDILARDGSGVAPSSFTTPTTAPLWSRSAARRAGHSTR